MRQHTAPLAAKLAVRTGTNPLLAIVFNWGITASWFATKTITLPNGEDARGNIIRVGACSCEKRDDSTGVTGSMSITLDDSDGYLKNITDVANIEHTPATIYLFYEDLGALDALALVKGKIAGPVVWSEGDRHLTFSIEVIVEEEEAGFIPTDEFEGISDESKSRPWPMIFGKCAHVPAVKIKEHRSGILKEGIRLNSELFIYEGNSLKMTSVSTLLNDSGGATIKVKDGHKFPQGIEIEISVDGVIFAGQFAEDVFTVSEVNRVKYNNISFSSRDSLDPDNTNPYVAWLSDPEINIQGHHVYLVPPTNTVNINTWYNYCVQQEGTKCIFEYPFISPVTEKEVLITSSHVIDRVYKIGEFGGDIKMARFLYDIAQTFRDMTSPTNGSSFKNGVLKSILEHFAGHYDFFWSAAAGSKVRLWNQDDPDVYIASLIPLTAFNAVYGRRKIKTPQGRDETFFSPIPSHYYTKNVANSSWTANSLDPATLTFAHPLEEMDEEGWEDEVYVTATSSVGPNAADIIEFILTTWTDLTINGTSFNTAASFVADTPCNFALFEKKDALEFAREIAWQSRMGLRYDSLDVDLIYLPDQPDPEMVFDASDTDEESLNLSLTPIDEIRTKFIARWNETYKNRSKNLLIDSPEFEGGRFVGAIVDPKDNDEKTTVYRNNIDLYGEREDSTEIYIYNEEEFILRTLEFWGYRKSNCWRQFSFRTYMPAALLQPWDAVVVHHPGLLLTNMLAIVDSWEFDAASRTIDLNVWLPFKAGQLSLDDGAFE